MRRDYHMADSGFRTAWPKSALISRHPELQRPLVVHSVVCISLLRDSLGSRRVLPHDLHGRKARVSLGGGGFSMRLLLVMSRK